MRKAEKNSTHDFSITWMVHSRKTDREVDFEQLGIGVDSSEIDYGDGISPSFIIPKRIYILELPGGL